MSIRSRATKIEKLAEELGFQVHRREAQTGTIYLSLTGEEKDAVVRVSDHQDAYGKADYTADGIEGTDAGCRVWLLGLLKMSEADLRRVRIERRKAQKNDLAARREDWIRGYAAQENISIEQATALCPIQK